MEVLQFSAAQLALLGTLIIGVNEVFVRLRARDLWVVATIVSAAVIGGLLGLYYNIDFVSGVAAGFSACGALKLVGAVGNKSTPAPSDIIGKG